MLKIVLAGLIVSLVLIPSSTVAYKAPPEAVKPSISDLVALYAKTYNVPANTLHRVIKCESRYNPQAHHLSSKEDSWGLVQINLKAHKNITKAQATDNSFAIEYLAKNISQGSGNMWTCFNLL